MKFIDLFAGIGGIRLGFEQAGGSCVFSSEADPHCQAMYLANFQEQPHGDITKVPLEDIPPHDVLCGGFPCQPFSVCGERQGFQDTRGTLIFRVFEIIEYHRPKIVFLENVRGLCDHDGGRTLQIIIESLEGLGYCVASKVLNAVDYGVPHSRERIFIVGSTDWHFDFTRVATTPRGKLADCLEDDPGLPPLEPYRYGLYDVPRYNPITGIIRVGYVRPPRIPAGNPVEQWEEQIHRQTYNICSSQGVSPCISSSNSWQFLRHQGEVRLMNITEKFRIMGFPPGYKKVSRKSQLHKQIGNSVAVPVVTALARQIKEQFFTGATGPVYGPDCSLFEGLPVEGVA